MVYLSIFLAISFFTIAFAVIVRKTASIQGKLEELEEQQKELLEINSMLEIEKDDLYKKQEKLDKELARAVENKNKEALLEEAHLPEFHIIKFTRLSAWGSPEYTISVDSLGHVLYDGKKAMRLIGSYEWKIYRKRLKNINSIIQKSEFFQIPEQEFKSELEDISRVSIEIFLKNGAHKKIEYDHAANYPMNLGFLERKLDVVLGTQKIWLYWGQNAVQFSVKRGLNYKVIYVVNQGVLYTILGQEFYSQEHISEWKEINDILLKYETSWTSETKESLRNHPRDTVWVELETGFRFLISPHKHPQAYQEFVQVVEDFGMRLQK